MRQPDSLSDPAQDGFAVVPADSDFTGNRQARALYIGTTGNIHVTTVTGVELTFNNVPVGFLPVSVKRVWSTGTTASNIVALW